MNGRKNESYLKLLNKGSKLSKSLKKDWQQIWILLKTMTFRDKGCRQKWMFTCLWS